MQAKNGTALLKACIVHGLLLLLKEKTLEQISIKEIVARAGVNRSTYYRHFQSKTDVIRFFYRRRLDEYLQSVPSGLPTAAYFAGMFESFLRYKDEILLLHGRGLSYLLLDEMNSRISGMLAGRKDAAAELYFHYHLGGVFNSFCFWLQSDMQIPPGQLARLCVRILPENFQPQLLRHTNEEEIHGSLSSH